MLINKLYKILSEVEKPARYTGEEINSIKKSFNEVNISFAFCFPDTYEVGMSHLGLKILYGLINSRNDALCERVFMPNSDMLDKMKEYNIPMFSIESKTAINKFDILGFTLQYEMTYTNILEILSLGQIEIFSNNRTTNDPFIIAGGPCAYNPEPLSAFIDAFIIGDGEEVTNELIDTFKESKLNKKTRFETLYELSKIEGVYVPAFYEVEYNEDNTIKSFFPIVKGVPNTIKKRIVYDMDNTYYPLSPTVPYIQVIHDRLFLEIMRGCTRGCRFCQAGMLYRPRREKNINRLKEISQKMVENTGYEEISLSSLSSGDYSCLQELMTELNTVLNDKKVSYSLPSLRIDGNIEESLTETQKVKKSSLTFAPEAGTQRLRDVINKCVTQDDLVRNVKFAFNNGWNGVKLYFMMGLPTETDEDLIGIANLAQIVKDEYYLVPKEKRAKGLRINVSVSVFVPKPFTPFQWFEQNDIDTAVKKQTLLREVLNIRGVSFSWHDSKLSIIEACFARGDRRMSNVLYSAWKNGCLYDGWSDKFKFEQWEKAFSDNNISMKFYTREHNKNEILPWDFIDAGISKRFLYDEYKKALSAKITPDCFFSNCHACGIQKTKGGCPKCV